MSGTLARIRQLVLERKYTLSDHAYEAAQEDGILPLEIINGVHSADVVEDYPDAKRGPSVLVLCRSENRQPIHAVWGIHRDNPDRAVVITAYKPEQGLWSTDFLKRVKP